MGSAITYGVLLLVFLTLLTPRRRTWALVVVVAFVVLIGPTRVAHGVPYPSDVLGGRLLGVLWLAVTAVAFHPWRTAERSEAAAEPSPAHDAPVPEGWRGAATLLAAAVLIWGAVAHRRHLADRIGASARCRLIEGAGHMLPMTHPQAVNEELLALLERVEPGEVGAR